MTTDTAARLKIVAAALVAILGTAGVVWYQTSGTTTARRGGPVETPPARTLAPAVPTAASPVIPVSAAGTDVAPPAAASTAAPPAIDAASGAAVPLEDVIGRSMPAVVRIETSGGLGSGFFVARDTILTNVHVVTGSLTVTVRLQDGRAVQGLVDATAPEFDIAVVKTVPADASVTPLRMGSALRTRQGQEVVALGAPLGLQNTVTRGIVSALRQAGRVMLVQTDAAINPGNSGGPLLDRSGSVVGITTMAVKPGVGQGLSFAVAIEHAAALLDGRLPSSSGATPAASLNQIAASPQTPAAPPAAASSERERGLAVFEQTVAQLAQDADRLDDRWRNFYTVCYRGQIVGTFDRPWFAVFDPRAMQGTVPAGCDAAFAEIKSAASRIREALRSADETARRADVYPGARRDVLRRFRLDYAGLTR